MEQQSNNRLDELFQKAAEEYPLKTNNKNWDIVAAKLHSAPSIAPRKKNNKWLYVALLIFLLGGSIFIIDNLNTKRSTIVANRQTALPKNNNNSDKSVDKSSKNSTFNITDNVQEQLISNQRTIANLNHKNVYAEHNASIKNINAELTDKENNISSNQLAEQSKPTAVNSNQSINNDSQQPGKLSGAGDNVFASASNSSTKKGKTDLAVSEKSEHVNLNPPSKTFYGVFFFAPDFSTVKFQHINKPGYSIGIALGYRINNRISAEVGLQRIHSNFYSDGKYFDTSNLKLKGRARLDNLNGNNKITEVPIAIRYNLLKNSNHLFASAGTSVAVITHTEKYDYNVMKNGEQKDVYRKFSALTGTKFFSSVNFSVGYQTSVANMFDVKIEPYYQVATKGLGVGNLPVSNFGVNIGIMKDLK
ncbi:MAG TPA: hypothetical protein VHB70_09440 [Parafilimonas sp.]|nr:hypothetical protein [Parafilimonas sp.]